MNTPRSLVQDLGRRALLFVNDLGGMSVLAGRTLYDAATAPYAVRLLLAQMGHIAVRSVTMVGVAGLFVGLVPSLLFNAEGAKVLEDVQAAAQNMRAVAADLQTITARLRQGEGTIGGLLEDPTVYEDLSALLRGANRSLLLKGLIRSTVEEGAREKR